MEKEQTAQEKVYAPRTMDACREAVKALQSEGYLLMDLSGVDGDSAQRIMDFVMGAAAALHATIESVGDRRFSVSIQEDERSQ